MRIDATDGEEFCALVAKHGGYPRIFLGDIEQEGVVRCDTKEGWVDRWVIDRDGCLVWDAHDDLGKTERVNGRVFIGWPDQVFI